MKIKPYQVCCNQRCPNNELSKICEIGEHLENGLSLAVHHISVLWVSSSRNKVHKVPKSSLEYAGWVEQHM
jgi:hypothetical protein